MNTYTCLVCGKDFESPIPRNRKNSPKYCSWDCQHFSMRKQSPKQCLICGTEFYSRYPAAKYCNRKCAHEAHRREGIINCEYCGKPFKRDKKAIRYCSQRCYGDSMLGAFPRKAKEFSKAVRRAIKARDNYACVLCRSTDRIQVDHIKAIGLGGDNSIENGRVLCFACHNQKSTEDKAKIRTLNKVLI